MASLNKVLVMGHLTRDPELRYTQSGAAVIHFGMAIHRRSHQGEPWRTEVTCFDIVIWGKLAEMVRQSLRQGSFAMVVGRLLGDTRETPQGQEGNQQVVVADHLHFISCGQGVDPGHRLSLKSVMQSLQRWARQTSRKRASRWPSESGRTGHTRGAPANSDMRRGQSLIKLLTATHHQVERLTSRH